MIRRLVQSALGTFGYRLSRFNSSAQQTYALGLAPFLAAIQRAGFGPKHIIDAGANHGNWTRETVKYFPDADYTLVEPQNELRVYAQDLVDAGHRIHWVNAGVSDRSAMLTLNVHRSDESSTFLEEPRTLEGAVRRIQVPVKTLNEIVASSGLPIPEMVKIDAEGFDLKALCGASDLLGKTDIFLAEVSVGQRDFENTPLAVMQEMADAGYRLVDVTHLNRSPKWGVLWLCEFVFLRNASNLLDGAISYE